MAHFSILINERTDPMNDERWYLQADEGDGNGGPPGGGSGGPPPPNGD